jgi:hypothetical protein
MVLTFFPSRGFSHPVAFKGAWSFMAFNQPDMLDWQLVYSFERKFSLGVDFFRDTMEGPDRYFLIPRLAWLVNRWNGDGYQANIYVYGGVGIANKQSQTDFAAEGSIETDYETRKFYISGKATVVASKISDTLAIYQFRTGFAPYEGDFEALHSWLIAQVQYLPFAKEEQLRVGPVLRLFYRNVLWELGVTTRATWNFNFMAHW